MLSIHPICLPFRTVRGRRTSFRHSLDLRRVATFVLAAATTDGTTTHA